jgi:DNA primase
MSDTWLTYAKAAEKLGVTVEAVRQRAIRGRWQRTQGNDGKARVRLPDGERTPFERTARTPVRTPPSDVTAAERLVAALEAHVATLKQDLEAERGRSADALAQLALEKARADESTSNFIRLTGEYQRLVDELVAVRRPWWRRVVRG